MNEQMLKCLVSTLEHILCYLIAQNNDPVLETQLKILKSVFSKELR